MLKWKNENNLKIINEINLICSNDFELLKENYLDKILKILTKNDNNENDANSVNKNVNDKEDDLNIKKYNLFNKNISKDNLFKKGELQMTKEIDIYYESKLLFSGNEFEREKNNILDKMLEIILKKDIKNYENLSQKINDIKDFNYLYHIFEFLQNKENEIIRNDEEIYNYKILKEYDDFVSSFNSKSEYFCFACKKKIKKKNCQYCQKILDNLDKNSNIINDINNILYSLYNYIFIKQIFYIGIFGNKGSGKSLIFNNIFGCDILTTNENECTKGV